MRLSDVIYSLTDPLFLTEGFIRDSSLPPSINPGYNGGHQHPSMNYRKSMGDASGFGANSPAPLVPSPMVGYAANGGRQAYPHQMMAGGYQPMPGGYAQHM